MPAASLATPESRTKEGAPKAGRISGCAYSPASAEKTATRRRQDLQDSRSQIHQLSQWLKEWFKAPDRSGIRCAPFADTPGEAPSFGADSSRIPAALQESALYPGALG